MRTRTLSTEQNCLSPRVQGWTYKAIQHNQQRQGIKERSHAFIEEQVKQRPAQPLVAQEYRAMRWTQIASHRKCFLMVGLKYFGIPVASLRRR